MIKAIDLSKLYYSHPDFDRVCGTLQSESSTRTAIEGLYGSSKALFLASVFNKLQTTHVVVLPEKEDAAFFYNDLVSLLGEELVFFFPSTYKRSIQYSQTESANIVLRTEVMNHLGSGKRKSIIITYTESLMEKLISKKSLQKNTLKIKNGDSLPIGFLEEFLELFFFVLDVSNILSSNRG